MSNTPEFGAGANTFNEVFGKTLNPWNTARSAAGSSGGAAVALATGMAWLAHGSDMGGSLRNPASFNGIVGFRPSIGRVAHTPSGTSTATSASRGRWRAMSRIWRCCSMRWRARTRAIRFAAAHRRSYPGGCALELAAEAGRVSADLGITMADDEVAAITRKAAERFAELGATVEEAHPDLDRPHECFISCAPTTSSWRRRCCCASIASCSSPR